MDIYASSHDHPLVLNHNMHNRHKLAFQLRCNKCRYPIVRGSFCSCFDCGYHLHYHCAVTMPPKINHPFHPQHPLSLCIVGSFTCAFCYPHYSNPLRQEYYSYSCIECNLKLDIECALAPTITCYDDQTQPLCHLQPMDLVEKEDGLSFSACCVLRVLKGELKDVELRIVGQNELDTEIMEKNLVLDKEKEENALVGEEGKASMTLMDLASKLSKKELDDLHLVLVEYKTYSSSEKHKPVEVQDNIQEFINSLQNSNYSSTRFQLTADDLKVKIVNVGNYKVTHNLAHILKDLLAKYGDVSGGDESKLSTAMKSMAFYLLCGLIHSLRKTLLVDVTENHLKDWFLRLKILESNGFKIGFVRSCIERILPSYLVFEAERVIDEDKKRVEEKIAGLQKKIQGIVTEMEKCKKDHEKLCERYKKTTKFMEDSESLISKYKIVGDDLF